MNLLPYEHFEILSPLDPDKAIVKLQKVVTSTEPGRYDIPDRTFLFTGKFAGNRFELLPNRYNKRSQYVPITKGVILPNNNGSRIIVKVSSNYALIVLGLILVCVEAGLIMTAIAAKQWPITILSILMPFVGYGLTVFIVKYDAANIKADLRKVFS